MDTKWKTMHKKTKMIVMLCVIIPALILTGLYPAMDKAASEKRNELMYGYNQSLEEISGKKVIEDDVVHYAVEASYYMYSLMKADSEKTEALDFFETYGWRDDYHTVTTNTEYFISSGKKSLSNYEEGNLEELISIGKNNARNMEKELEERGIEACFILEFDEQGNVFYADFFQLAKYGESTQANVLEKVYASINQFRQNAMYYEWSAASESDLQPKNLQAVYTLSADSSYIVEDNWYAVSYSEFEIYEAIGALVLILSLAAVVAILALVLPAFKALDTGWESIFSLPAEIVLLLMGVGFGGAVCMTEVMCNYNSMEWFREYGPPAFLGIAISPEFSYGAYLVANFLGWSACFLLEYIVVVSVRQFLCRPKYYVQNRILCINIVKWFWGKILKAYRALLNMRFDVNMNRKIAKIVLINAAIITFMCLMLVWSASGWLRAGDIILLVFFIAVYSTLLYLALVKYLTKINAQHEKVLNATRQIADGYFKVNLDNDLGMFEQIGNELGKLQVGFEKAVAEEAKSQKMKTELITNVSHDLKTPLTALITYIDLLKKEEITEEERKSYIATLEQKSQRLKMLIEDLFEVSKADSGNIQLNLMDVDIVNLMKEVRLEMEDKIAASNLSFKWNLPNEKVILYLDGKKTYRIFTNLLNNVLKYAMDNSRVYVDMTQDANEVVIMFRNISANELYFESDKLTDRFVRGDESRNTEGSGLGLAIVKSFVELQGGKFKVDVDGDLFKATIIWRR